MVDLRPKKEVPKTFAVSRSPKAAPVIKSRERQKIMLLGGGVLMMVLAIALFANPDVVAKIFGGGGSTEITDPDNVPLPEKGFDAVVKADLTALPALPALESLEAEDDKVQMMFRNEGAARLHLRTAPWDDTLAFAWSRRRIEKDRDEGTIPQGYAPEDLARGISQGRLIRVGSYIHFSGTLEDLQDFTLSGETGEAWYSMNIAIPNRFGSDLYALVVAPRWATSEGADGQGDLIATGLPTRFIGRYLGEREVPGVEGKSTRVPLFVARSVRQGESDAAKIFKLLNVGKENEPHHQAFRHDDEVYDKINDEYPLLETRPYYYLLGQVKLDTSTPGVYDNVKDGNQESFNLHIAPSEYRGEAYTVHGYVWDAWVDEVVERDRPYEVSRVHRIRFYKRIYNVPHRVHDLQGRESVSTASVLHAYEVAAFAEPDQELPKRGDEVKFTGRFLKVHGYPCKTNPMQDQMYGIRRQSDNVYFKMFVAPAYQSWPRPAAPNYLVFGIGATIISFSFLFWMLFLINKDEKHADDYKRSVRRLRRSRKKLGANKNPAGDEAEGEADGAESEPAESTASETAAESDSSEATDAKAAGTAEDRSGLLESLDDERKSDE